MTDAEVIAALGGPTKLARALGLRRPQMVSMWKARRIPAEWRPRVLGLLRASRVTLDEDAFLGVPDLAEPSARAA